MKSFLVEDNDRSLIHRQQSGCCWHGGSINQHINRCNSSNGLPKYSDWRTNAINHTNNHTALNKTTILWITKDLIYRFPKGPVYWHGLNSVPAWISNYFHYRVYNDINHPFPNFSVTAIEVKEWIPNKISKFMSMWIIIRGGLQVNTC